MNFVKEYLKLVSYNRDKIVFILFPLQLLLVKANPVPKKRCSKKNLVSILSSNGSKIILTLLTEIIVFYVKFSAILV